MSATRRETAVSITALTAGYGDRAAVSEVNLDLAVGSLTAIFGPNGGGKSTLLKCAAGLMRPWSGSVEVPFSAGRPGVYVARLRRDGDFVGAPLKVTAE